MLAAQITAVVSLGRMPHPADMNTVDSSDQSVGEGQFHPGGP